MQFSFTFCIGLVLFSKHLLFLSFHTDHHMQEGTRLHHFFCFLLPPLLIQQVRRSAVCSGITHGFWMRLRNIYHTWEVTLQWRNKWLFVSSFSLQKKHVETISKPLFFSFSWVRHALQHTFHVKPLILVGILDFHICFQGPGMFPGCEIRFLLINLPTENFPSVSCLHLILSGLVFKPEKSFNLCSRLATLSISQSFRSLLKKIFHPWLVQVSAMDASGLSQKE